MTMLMSQSAVAAAPPAQEASPQAGEAQGRSDENAVRQARAVNRNELLPAIGTSQGDIGLRYVVTPDIRLAATLFEVRKPYFNFGRSISEGAALRCAGCQGNAAASSFLASLRGRSN